MKTKIFWVANNKWQFILQCKAYDKYDEYTKKLYKYMNDNNLSLCEFRSKLYLCSKTEARRRKILEGKLVKKKRNGGVFLSDEEIDNIVYDMIKKLYV